MRDKPWLVEILRRNLWEAARNFHRFPCTKDIYFGEFLAYRTTLYFLGDESINGVWLIN